jgi:5-methylcytosine-specific restriction enzyme subunit McrC
MNSAPVIVREYARLTTALVDVPTLDYAQVPESAFEWLCELSASFTRGGAPLVQVDGRRALRLDNYVGVLQTPCGTTLEILPKHTDGAGSAAQSRELLGRMLRTVLDLSPRETAEADLQRFKSPLHEWVMRQFLLTLDHLLKRGIRFDYQRLEEEQRFLRGQLDVMKQMRQPPGRQHCFQIRHDVFLPDRSENRLLRTALERVCKTTQEPGNWRLAHELRGILQEIPLSQNVAQDFKQWRRDRLMAHYLPAKPWCELVLGQHMPFAIAGGWRGISLLFPMEQLFEKYVAIWLCRHLAPGASLRPQASSQFLCQHDGKAMFQMQPDLLVEQGSSAWVLDTKWKRLDAAKREDKYGLSQQDFYQLFAYGQHYLKGEGELVLIYPKSVAFAGPLPPFDFQDGKRLWVVPFDLDTKTEGLLAPCEWNLPCIEGGYAGLKSSAVYSKAALAEEAVE